MEKKNNRIPKRKIWLILKDAIEVFCLIKNTSVCNLEASNTQAWAIRWFKIEERTHYNHTSIRWRFIFAYLRGSDQLFFSYLNSGSYRFNYSSFQSQQWRSQAATPRAACRAAASTRWRWRSSRTGWWSSTPTGTGGSARRSSGRLSGTAAAGSAAGRAAAPSPKPTPTEAGTLMSKRLIAFWISLKLIWDSSFIIEISALIYI